MDKNIIKKHLTERFLSEETTPGIDMAKKMKKEETKINSDGVKAIDKDMATYDKDLKKKDKNEVPANKFNYNDDFEKTYHDEMEIMNGQEMIQYDRLPNKDFKEKAKEGIEGSSRMGNEGGKGIGNAEAIEGASSDDFGKNLVKKIKDSEKKRSEQTPTLNLRGRDIQADIKDTGHKPYAFEDLKENKTITPNKTKESMKRLKFKKEFEGSNTTQKIGHALTLIPEGYKTDNKEFEMTDGNVTCRVRWEGTLTEGKAVILSAKNTTLINEDISRMKALFNYKSESTLGLVKGNARLDENAAFADVYAKTKKLLGEEEDIESVTPAVDDLDNAGINQAPEAKKHIEGSVKEDPKTNAPKPKEGNWEEAKTGAKSAKQMETKAPKAKEGEWEEAKTGVAESATDKKTMAPKAKVAPFEEAPVKVAPEATKHIEGSVKADKKTEADKPKEGNPDDAVNQAPEAKKHIEDKKGTELKATAKKKIAENEIPAEDGEDDVEVADTWNKPEEDDSSSDDEPTAKDIKAEPVPAMAGDDDEDDVVVPPVAKAGAPKLMVSQSTGKHYLMVGKKPTEVPEHLVVLAKKNPSLALTKIQDAELEAPEVGGSEEVEEGLFGKSPEQIKKIGMEAINMHPMKKKAYQQFLGEDPVKAEKYLMFVGNNPDAKQISWDDQTQNFVNKAIMSVASGEGLAGK